MASCVYIILIYTIVICIYAPVDTKTSNNMFIYMGYLCNRHLTYAQRRETKERKEKRRIYMTELLQHAVKKRKAD